MILLLCLSNFELYETFLGSFYSQLLPLQRLSHHRLWSQTDCSTYFYVSLISAMYLCIATAIKNINGTLMVLEDLAVD